MKVIFSKKFWKKMLFVVFIVLIMFSVFSNISNAATEWDFAESWGGKLLSPIMNFFVSIADAVYSLLQSIVVGQEQSLFDISVDFLAYFIAGLIVVAIIIGVIVSLPVSGGVTLVVGAKILLGAVLKVGLAVAIVYPVSVNILKGQFGDSVTLPVFELSPYEIFSNKTPLFDVNFFDPMETNVKTSEKNIDVSNLTTNFPEEISEFLSILSPTDFSFVDRGELSLYKLQNNIVPDEVKNGEYGFPDGDGVIVFKEINEFNKYNFVGNGLKDEYEHLAHSEKWYSMRFWINGNIIYQFECEGSVSLLGGTVNNAWNLYKYEAIKEPDGTLTASKSIELKSTALQLQPTISKWYVTIRNIAALGMLSVLVYVGIRILLSSTAADKAKYKNMLMDWLVGMCILFFMHYIMTFSNVIVDKIIGMIDSIQITAEDKEYVNSEVSLSEIGVNSISEDYMEKGVAMYAINDSDLVAKAEKVLKDTDYEKFIKEDVLYWPANNFLAQARIEGQKHFEKYTGSDKHIRSYESIAYMLIYVVLVIYTVIFSFTYLKRVIYMAFLTIIAPFVALTYPIDKLHDGKAQGFDWWLKEYVFNLLLQPVHLLLYMILIGSAMNFAAENIIYVVVCLGFMIPAEKLLRQMFSFSRASTPGLLGGAAGGALMMTGIKNLMGLGSKHDKGNSGKADDNSDSGIKSVLHTKSSDPYANNVFLGGGSSLPGGGAQGGANPLPGGGTQGGANPLSSGGAPEGANPLPSGGAPGGANPLARGTQANRNPSVNLTNNENPWKRAFKAAGGAYIRGQRRKAINRAKNSHPLKFTRKLATGALGAAAFATAGGIAGIVSGDPSKAASYMALGAAGGYKFGQGVGDNISSALSVDGAIQAGKQAYYGSGLKDEEMERYYQEWIDKEENIQKINNNLGYEAMKNMKKNGRIKMYLENGINNVDDIIATEMSMQNGMVRNINDAIAVTKVSKRVGDFSEMKEKDREDWRKTLKQDFKNGNPNLTDAQLDNMVNGAIRFNEAFYTNKNNIF